MTWEKKYIYIPQYKYSNANQHGCTYRKVASKRLCVARMTAKITDADDLSKLILLSHHLDIPVRYDFESSPQTAYIEVVSNEALAEIK